MSDQIASRGPKVIKIDSTTTKITILTAWFEVATACSIMKKTPTMAEGRIHVRDLTLNCTVVY